ncbi:MAG: T9SS type A sorting domain-containing protein [bacterium]
MRTILTIALTLFLSGAAGAQNYQLDWLSINSGGEVAQTSASYGVGLTVAQAVAGHCESANYQAYLGFWHPLMASAVAVEQIETPTLPTQFSLEQNYPNPFNPTTTIEFSIPRGGQVRIEVYNMLGQLVTLLSDGPLPAGLYRVVWDGRDIWGNQVASGVYLYRLQAGDYLATRKMLLLK